MQGGLMLRDALLRSAPRHKAANGSAPNSVRPRGGVQSREISECLNRRAISEALQSGAIVIADEADEEGVALFVRGEPAVGAAAFGLATDGFGDAAVEAFHQPVRLWPIRPGQPVFHGLRGADFVE